MTEEVAIALLRINRAVVTSDTPKPRQAILLNAIDLGAQELKKSGLLTEDEVRGVDNIRDVAFEVFHRENFPDYRHSPEVMQEANKKV